MAKHRPINGISCNIYKAKNESEHFHQDVEMVFVIEGRIKIVVDNNEFIMGPEEILLINSNKPHYTSVMEDALICRINISYNMLLESLGDEYVAFWCNTLTEGDMSYIEIRDIMRKIILLKLDDNQKDTFRLMEFYSRLINILIRDFKVNTGEWNQERNGNDTDRVKQVINYINLNYYEPISLQNLADRLYVSVSTLSRVFKKTTGVKFPDYVNQIRMNHALNDLLNTNKSITDIAVDNGFSSPSTFNRVFKEVYNTSPSLYKKSVRNVSAAGDTKLTQEDEAQIRHYLGDNHLTAIAVEEHEVVDIYPDNYREFKKISNKAISAGAFFTLTGSIVQGQVKQMVEKLGLEYIRVWNVFSPKCMIADSPSDKDLNFEYINAVLDFLVGIHVHPFLDMTDHPDCLIKSGRELLYKKDDSMGFENLEQWSYFMDRFMDHVVFRYGHEEVSKWIFELGDLPLAEQNQYQARNPYKNVFPAAYRIIKSYCPEAKVGGPDWIFDGSEVDMDSYFRQWREADVVPDFYTVFLFPYKATDGRAQEYLSSKERNMDPEFMENQIHEIHKCLKAAGAPERPLIVAETSTILSNRNAMNDHLGRGTNVLRITNLFQDYADMVCFWVATDRISLRYAPPSVLHGGSGLVTKDGIPKPSLFALYFLNKMGDKLIGRGKGYIATETSHNGYYILCYNHKNLSYNYRFEEEDQVNVYNVDDMFEDNMELNLKFMLHGLEADGEYVIKRHIVNHDSGSIMDEWKNLGFEPELRSNDIEYLKNVCVPRVHMGHRIAEEGQIFLEANLKAHEMQLIHVYKFNK